MNPDVIDQSQIQDIINSWNAGQQEFAITTSGSTGQPKPFLLQRPQLIWSAQQTLKHFIEHPGKQLICLPVNKVGGFMQIIRSLVWQQPFYYNPPSANPLLNPKLPSDCTIASFTPHQLYHILQHPESQLKLHQFQSVLIGGGELSPEMEKQLIQQYPKTQFVHTFGMTETYSHFAGRFLGDDWYQLTDNIEISVNQNQCLVLRSPITQNQWLTTNDVVEIQNIDFHKNSNNSNELPKYSQRFKWIGRSDFTINSGGIKIQIETVENQIIETLNWSRTDFFCWGFPHESLGQELTLIVLSESLIIQDLNLQQPPTSTQGKCEIQRLLAEKMQTIPWKNPYLKPRRIEIISPFIYTETQKIQREKTVQLL
jgi:O-succinylbenzoic acid--CoA ligase